MHPLTHSWELFDELYIFVDVLTKSKMISDALVAMEKAMKRDEIETNDRQLACARIKSEEGQNYLKSMAAAANFAWVNRSSMTFLSRQVRWWDAVSTTVFIAFLSLSSTRFELNIL